MVKFLGTMWHFFKLSNTLSSWIKSCSIINHSIFWIYSASHLNPSPAGWLRDENPTLYQLEIKRYWFYLCCNWARPAFTNISQRQPIFLRVWQYFYYLCHYQFKKLLNIQTWQKLDCKIIFKRSQDIVVVSYAQFKTHVFEGFPPVVCSL